MRSSYLLIALALLAGCASPFAPRTGAGTEQTMHVALPPERAAACFARNAEEHSSALVAEVNPGRDRSQVVVRVKNGVLYAIGDFDRAGSGSTAKLTLNVTTSGSRSDLVDALLEGC
jgi:hypothetical protein